MARILFNWYTAAALLAALGVAAGLLIFFYAFPGKPKIGVIDIPFTVISEDSTFVITEYLNYARRDDSIKAVVIRLTSPGGGAAASERLYQETRRLREEKPVVIVMNGLVASGGYMMSMGASHTYAQTSSLVGNVGVVSFADPLIPPNLPEPVMVTGPYKDIGFSRQEWMGTLEDLKEAFAEVVVTERGDRLRITREALTQGRLYPGIQAVRLGLADELGSDSDAFEKASELAGIANYGLVDVNYEVLKRAIKELTDIFPEPDIGDVPVDTLALLGQGYSGGDPAPQSLGIRPNSNMERLEALRGLMLYGRLGLPQDDPLPGFPLELNHPNFYYLYVGDAR